MADKSVAEGAGTDVVTAHQVLHGYKDGHRALESSVVLPPMAGKTLLRLSDAGDVDPESNYPTLLSGFPLPDTTYYAFSKTWPAPESDRPGAVWSHTLLFDYRHLAALSPSDILSAFRRPSSVGDATYSHPVTISPNHASPSYPISEQISLIVWALYEGLEKPVCATLDSMGSAPRERLLIGLFLQQWPDLQSKFSFAEAPLWERRIQGSTFDLHATTSSGISSITKGRSGEFRIVRESAQSGPPAWARLTAHELATDRGLREFLGRFGPALPAQRSSVSDLAEVWTAAADAGSEQQIEHVLKIVNRRFPRRSEMAPLKTWLLGEQGTLLSMLTESDLLRVLARSSDSQCLSAITLRIASRSTRLWETRRADAVDLLEYVLGLSETGTSSHLVPQILKGLGRGMRAGDVVELGRTSFPALRSLVQREPDVLTKRELWRSDQQTVTRLIRLAASLSLSEELVRKAVVSILAVCKPGDTARVLFKEWPATFTFVLDIASKHPAKARWLRKVPDEILGDPRVSIHPQSVLRLAAGVSSKEAKEIPAGFWIRAVPAMASADHEVPTRALARLLAVGLSSDAPGADELAASSYSRLYSDAVGDLLHDRDIKDLLQVLPMGGKGMDLGEAMVVALAEAFRKRKSWRLESLLLVTDRRAFKDLLNHDAQRYSGNSAAAALASMAPDVRLSQPQTKAVREVLRQHGKKEDLLDIVEALLRRIFS